MEHPTTPAVAVCGSSTGRTMEETPSTRSVLRSNARGRMLSALMCRRNMDRNGTSFHFARSTTTGAAKQSTFLRRLYLSAQMLPKPAGNNPRVRKSFGTQAVHLNGLFFVVCRDCEMPIFDRSIRLNMPIFVRWRFPIAVFPFRETRNDEEPLGPKSQARICCINVAFARPGFVIDYLLVARPCAKHLVPHARPDAFLLSEIPERKSSNQRNDHETLPEPNRKIRNRRIRLRRDAHFHRVPRWKDLRVFDRSNWKLQSGNA